MDSKTSVLRTSPETHFLANRPKELELQSEIKLLLKENNYLQAIIDRMTKALLDPRPEFHNPKAMELFNIGYKGELGRYPDGFLHKFEFLEPLLLCYDEKINRLEMTNSESQEKLLMLEKTFDEVVAFFKGQLEEKDKKIIELFTDKYENDDPVENSDFVFQNQILKNEQKEYLKILQEEHLLNDQLTKDYKNQLASTQAKLDDIQTKLDMNLLEYEKLKELHTKLESKNLQITEQKEIFRIRSEELSKNLIESENIIIELKNIMQNKEKDYVLTQKRAALDRETITTNENRWKTEIFSLKTELQSMREKETDHRSKLQQYFKELQENDEKIKFLEKSKESLELLLSELKERTSEDSKRIEEFRRNEEIVKKKEKTSEELIYKLSAQVDQLELNKTTLEQKIEGFKENYENELLKLSEDKGDRIDNIDKQYHIELEKKEEEILRMQSEMYTLKVNAERIGKENNMLKVNLKEYLSFKDDNQRVLIEKNRVIKDLRVKMHSLDDDLNRRVLSMTFEKNSLETTLESFKDQMDNTSDKIKSLNSTINSINSEKGTLKAHIENLMKDKEELIEKLESIRKRLLEKYEDLLD